MNGKLVVAALLISAVASAKPLPAGMKVTLVKKKVMVSQNGVSVPIADIRHPVNKLTGAVLSDDGKSIEIKTDNCDGMLGDGSEPESYALAPVQAKLENNLGMSLHTKKKYADAITHFTAAIALDPQPVYVTNLLSAQTMGGKLDDADKTLATWGKKQTPWIAWRLAVDPELKKLAGRPSAKLENDKPGKAKGNLWNQVAVSPLGFAAVETAADSDFESMGDTESVLVFVELASGNEVLRLPTEYQCMDAEMAEGQGMPAAEAKACVKKHAAANAKNRKVADALLAQLGFEVVPKAYVDPRNSDGPIKTPEGKVFEVDKLAEPAWAIYFVPKYTVFETRDKIMTDCAGMGDLHMSLSATPRP